jgi:predicted Rossmann fold nucleotide-binding protein DprA/Smf involved in DNA uptake
VTCAGDVLELFGLEPAAERRAALGPAAETVLTRLREGALTADEVVLTSGLDAAKASAALVELELARLVTLEDGVYRAAV